MALLKNYFLCDSQQSTKEKEKRADSTAERHFHAEITNVLMWGNFKQQVPDVLVMIQPSPFPITMNKCEKE